MTQPDPAQPSASPSIGDVTAPARGDDAETVYFEGRPVLRAQQAKATAFALLGLGLIALPVLANVFDWTWWETWMTVACIVLAILAIVIPILVMRSIRYRITNYRIDFERGILKKKIDTMELWHVDDISFEQGLIDRMFNVGTIRIMSDDRTTPRLDLDGIPHPRKIFDNLRQRIIAVKRQRGVIKMDHG